MSSSPSRRMKIGDFLLRRLEEAGVRHLFGVPGDYNLELLQQLEDTGTLKWVGTCSELNASYAADGYARLTGLAVTNAVGALWPRVAVPPFKWRDLMPGAAVCTGAAVIVHAVVFFFLRKWVAEYGHEYGGFGVSLALIAAIGIISSFWIWIAAVMGVYWEHRAGPAAVAEMEELSAEISAPDQAAGPGSDAMITTPRMPPDEDPR